MPLCGRLNYKYMMLAARGPSITETQSWERDDTVDYILSSMQLLS